MDNLMLVQLLKTLYDRQSDDADANSYDNTVIQFFEAPHDNATLTASLQAQVGGTALSASPNDTSTFKATASATPADPTTFTWGGYDANGTYWNAGWYWGYGGTWK